MSLTNAQRQAAYRARHLHDIDGQGVRLNAVVSIAAKRALERLASYYGIDQRATLERVLAQAERGVLAQLAGRSRGDLDYYDRRLRAGSESVTP